MTLPSRHFLIGVARTAQLAVLALRLAQLPGVEYLGGLAIALLLGLALRAVLRSGSGAGMSHRRG